MDIKVTDKEKSQKEIAITVPVDVWAQEMDAAIDHYRSHVKASGFREGKAPNDVVIREVGQEAITAEAAERAIKKAYATTVKQEDIKAIAQPEVKITKIAEGNDLEFTATVAVLPEISLKKGWEKDVAKANAENKKKADAIEVTDAEIDEELARMAKQNAENVVVDRAAKKDDVAIVDFIVKMDGAPIEGGTGTDHPLVLGSNSFIPGFEDAVIGMVAGEEKSVTLPFPEQYHAEHLAGKDAEFAITLKRVEEQVMPEMDDAFAAKVNPQTKTMDELKKHMRDGMVAERTNQMKQEGREEIAEALAKNVEAELPEALIDNEMQRMEQQFAQQLSMQGTNLDEMLERLGKTKDELTKDWRPQAEKRAKIGLALDYVAETEKVELEKEKIEAEMQQMLMMYGGEEEAKKKVDLEHLYAYVKGMQQQEATFAYLENLEA